MGANIYQKKGVNGTLDLMREISFPEGRLRDQEIESDRPGRANTPAHGRRTAFSSNDAHDHLAQKFASQISDQLLAALNQNSFDRLVLVAEANFLGKLREALDHNLKSKVIQELDRDLGKMGNKEVNDYLNGALDLRQPVAAS